MKIDCLYSPVTSITMSICAERLENSSNCNNNINYSMIVMNCRAGHATTLSRQRDHIFRGKHYCRLLHYAFICFDYSTPFRYRDLNIFRIFLDVEVLVRCRVVVVVKLNSVAYPALMNCNNNVPGRCARLWRKQ